MDLNEPILSSIRETVVGSSTPSLFDKDILMYINGAIGTLNQNGIGNPVVVSEQTTWGELQNSEQTEGNKYFHMIPLFLSLSTKLLFDPPPPSSVQYHSSSIDQLLWRLKLAYEDMGGE